MPTASEVAAQLNAAFGEGTVKLGADIDPVKHWPTGILPIDVVLDGGLPVGRFTEVYGDYSTLKSYLGYKAIAAVQAMGGTTALVDAEHAYDAPWAADMGVQTGDLLVQRPDTAEDAVAVMEVLIRAGYDLIVWDSIAASQPKQYKESRPGEDNQPGALARVMSKGLQRLNTANKTTAILAINQTRINVGMTYGGSKDAMPGGRAMPYYASYRMRFTKAGRESNETKVWDGEKLVPAKEQVIQKIKVTMEKWKLNAPIREVWFNYDLRTGQVDESGFMLGWAIEHGYVTVGGNGNYSMGDWTVRGKDRFFREAAEDQELMEWLKNELTKDFLLASPGSPVLPAKSKGGSRKGASSKTAEQ